MSESVLQILIKATDLASGVMKGIGGEMGRLQKASGALAKDGFGKIQNSGKTMITGLAIGIPILGGLLGGLGINAVNTAGKYETLKVALETSLGSQDAAAKGFEQITAFAAKTPFQLEEVTSGFIKLKNMGLDNGEKALTSYGDTASAMGKSLNDMVEAVADAATGEFERLKEFGIRASSQGNKVSFTFKGVTTTVGKNSKEIQDYLIKLGQTNFAGGMDKQSQTLAGKFSTLKDTFDLTMASFANDTGLSEWAKGAIDSASKVMGGIKPLYDLLVKGDYSGGLFDAFGWFEDSDVVIKILDIRNAISEVFQLVQSGGQEAMDGGMWIDNLFGPGTAKVISDFIVKFNEVKDSVQKFLEQPKVMESILAGLAGVITTVVLVALGSMAVAVVAATWPFIAIFAAVSVLFYFFQTNLPLFAGLVAVVGTILWAVFIPALWAKVTALYAAAAAWLALNWPIVAIIIVIGLVVAAVVWLWQNWNWIWPAIVAIAGQAWEAIKGFFGGIGKWFGDRFNEVKGHFDSLMNKATAIKDGIMGAFQGMQGAVGNALKGTVNSVITNLNNAISGVNAVIRNIPDIPGIGKIPTIPEIPKFANGGIVGGNSTSGDRILARVNSGELILNQRQQRNLDSQLSSKTENNNVDQGVIIQKVEVNIGSYMGTEKDKRNVAEELADAIIIAIEKRKPKPA